MTTTATARRAIVLLAFLAVVLCAQVASVDGLHNHRNSSQHRCAICHTGELPILSQARVTEAAPLLAGGWLPLSSDGAVPPDTSIDRHASRAPPLSANC